MRTFLIICIFFSMVNSTYAQTGAVITRDTLKTKLNDVGITLKTDVLSAFNSLLEKEMSEISVSGEICFNKKYSIQLNTDVEKTVHPDNSHTAFRFDTELRKYIMKDYCSCSALHVGVFAGFEDATNIVDQKGNNISHIKYTESAFETGLAGGYEAIINSHWVIDPTVYAGVSTIYHSRVLESVNSFHEALPTMLNVRIVLQIGYRF